MDSKSTAIVSYITFIGWLISFFMNKDRHDEFARYHLRQSFGLLLTGFLFNIVINSVLRASAMGLVGFVNLMLMVMAVIGIINASGNKMVPLPVIGKFFEDKFGFIR